MVRGIKRRLPEKARFREIGIAAVALLPLSGCSVDKVADALNPVTWYHDLTGTSATANGDKGANAANLEAGSKEDYPNLSTVPDEPTRGLTEDEKKQLAEGLISDREHAHYTDDQIRSGNAAAVMPAPAALPAGVADAGTPPSAAGRLAVGGALASRVTPQPETPRPPPPPPTMPPVPPPTASATPPAAPAPPASQQVAAAPVIPPARPAIAENPQSAPATPSPAKGRVSDQIASVSFSPGSNAMPASATPSLAEVATKHQQLGGTVRVVGYAATAAAGSDAAGQQLDSYQAALARANAVKQALVSSGMDASQIVTEVRPVQGSPTDRTDIYADH